MTKYAKALVPLLVTVLAGAVAQGLISGAGAAWVTVVLGALSSAGVYAVKNAGPA